MINNVTLIGYTTKKPELKYTQSNIPFVNFTLAVNRPFKNENGESETDWIQCIVWRKQSENMAKYVDKGHLIGVVGRIQTRTYEDDNGTKYITEVVADSIQFLESKSESKKNEYPQTDEQIDETFKYGNPTNKPSILTKSQVREDKKKEFKSSVDIQEEDLPFD